jgi:hypothetical protein
LKSIRDKNEYLLLRRQILAICTKAEHARANRIASQMDPSQINLTVDPLIKAKLLKRQQKDRSIFVHYKNERRFTHYKTSIHRLWEASFPASTGIDKKLIVGTCNNPNLTNELVRRSPPRHKMKQNNKLTTSIHASVFMQTL